METQSATPITPELAASLLPTRPNDSHKGTFGKALIIAGSSQYPGAANLAIQAALRSGVGLVYAAIPESIYIPLAASIPEAIWLVLPQDATPYEKVSKIGQSDLFPALIGPGLAQEEQTREFLLAFLAHLRNHEPELPVVIDADALNILSKKSAWPTLLPKNAVLTPHEMEFSRLTGLPVQEIHDHRQDSTLRYAKEWGQTVILKGANTLVASSWGEIRCLPFANSVLAHGGTGDVLAGLVIGLLAQGLAPFDAATLAVWLHARAAELALGVVGHPAATLPSDIIRQLGAAMKSL